MKVLFVINSLTGGGAEKLITDLCLIYSREGWKSEVIIFSSKEDKYSDFLKEHGITVSVIEGKNPISNILYMKKILEKNSVDVIHANLFPSIYYCAVLKGILGKKMPPLIMTEHNTDNKRRHHKMFRPIEKFIYSFYETKVSISEGTQKALMNWLGKENDDSFCIINNGVPIVEFEEAFPIERCKIEQTISEDDILICMIGSFTEQKNYEFAVRVMKYLPKCFKLLCLGEGQNIEKIQWQVQDLNLTDRVVFLGFRRNVASILKASDIQIIPSKWEGFGLVAVEGLACGKQIVAADVPGLSEVIGEAGRKINTDEPSKFAEEIMEALNSPIDEGLIRNRAKTFDIQLTAERYLELYLKVIKNN